MKRRARIPTWGSPPLERDRPLNCLLTPHRKLARETSEMHHTLNAERAVLRPVWAYLGPSSAEGYRLFVRRCPDAHARAASLGQLAALIRPHLGAAPLEVLALGSGEGQHDVLLAAQLLTETDRPSSLGVVDLSEPLLAAAYVHAVDALPHAAVWALLADLEELSTYSDRLYIPGRQRLIVLLGGTLGELDDELRFLRYGLAFCTAGDLLVLEVPLSAGEQDSARWERQGEAAQRRLAAAQAWLTSALAPYLDGEPLAWSLRLDGGGAVPGSYAWTAVARRVGSPLSHEIELWRCKHYQPAALAQRLGELGWDPIAAYRYGDSQPGELHVYRRREQP